MVISESVIQYIPSTGIINQNEPVGFELSQNYPNPFNPETSIKFSINKSALTSLKVFDVSGKEVASLLNEKLIEGSYVTKFNGSLYSSGVYYYTLISGEFSQTKKMLMIK